MIEHEVKTQSLQWLRATFNRYPKIGSIWRRALHAFALLVGLLVLLILLQQIGWAKVFETLERLGAPRFLTICGTQLVLMVLAGLAWASTQRRLSSAHRRAFVTANLLREASGLLPFGQLGGLVLAMQVLTAAGKSAPIVIASGMLDALARVASFPIYLAIGLTALSSRRFLPGPPMLAIWIMVAAGLIGLGVYRVLPLLTVAFHRHFPGPWTALLNSRLASRYGWLTTSDWTPLRSRLGVVWLAHLALWIANGLQTWLILYWLSAKIGGYEAVAIDSLTSGARLVMFFVPAGLGVQEASLILFCGMFGLPPDIALALSLTRRARDLAPKAVITVAALAVSQFKRLSAPA